MTAHLPLQLSVHAVERLHPLLYRLELRAPEGRPLPNFEPGSHIRVQVRLTDGATDWRHYSLINFEPAASRAANPHQYTVAVRLEESGRGGSKFMHGLQAGDTLNVEAPRNEFPLHDHGGTTILVAGGIGVTPLTAMAAERCRQERPVRMLYAGRNRAQLAFVDELRSLLGDALALHVDEEVGRPLDAAAVLDSCGPDDVLYVCGPQPMLDALLGEAQKRGWPPERVRFELFSAPAAQIGDQAFNVVLQRSGETLQVPADKTILECLEAHGCDVLSDCRRGECGICAVDVVEGEIDHRDHVLTASEKAAGKVIQVCVSRAKGPRLVLAL
ncbi:PDR/VanB family oxidoreductase [Variovorax sp. GB1P17]|uniref:PDR/VanB family oxidoreductase n=1 Tax=Variovorax sp. GB1P17 TaxID=3443740 RepID=UPI003F462487